MLTLFFDVIAGILFIVSAGVFFPDLREHKGLFLAAGLVAVAGGSYVLRDLHRDFYCAWSEGYLCALNPSKERYRDPRKVEQTQHIDHGRRQTAIDILDVPLEHHTVAEN